MINYDYLYVLWVSFIGVVLTIAYQLEEIIENKVYETTSKKTIALLLLAKSIVGAILINLVFFALNEININFTVFGKHVVFGTTINLLIASVICLWGSDFYKTTHRLLKRKSEEV